MSVLEATATAERLGAVTNVARVSVAPRKKVVGTLQCLIVSTQPERRLMLEDAAHDGGWDTVVCHQADAAWTALKRQRYQLVLMDIDGTESLEELMRLSEEVAGMRNTLLVLCGNEGVPLEEIWARQLGAWLYLPGVTLGSDVASLCEQAKPVAEKLLGNTLQGVGSEGMPEVESNCGSIVSH